VRQCVDGVVALCRLARAQIVLTSSWRLLEGKAALLDDLLQRHHGTDAIYDVTPDLESQHMPLGALEEFNARHFVRVSDREGLTSRTALAALEVLGASDASTRATLASAFDDPDYDLNVFSESTREYSRACYSPRSRRAADWVHEPCSPEFARRRCQEVLLWLHHAAKSGISVSQWVVIDDDDLLQTSSALARTHVGRQRTGSTVHDIVKSAAPQKKLLESETLVPPSAMDCPDADPWAFAF